MKEHGCPISSRTACPSGTASVGNSSEVQTLNEADQIRRRVHWRNSQCGVKTSRCGDGEKGKEDRAEEGLEHWAKQRVGAGSDVTTGSAGILRASSTTARPQYGCGSPSASHAIGLSGVTV